MLDLSGRDPDEGVSSIAYDKGYFFLRYLENLVGREKWDAFFKAIFRSTCLPG
jgi:leukotriene-A4 hydrolase